MIPIITIVSIHRELIKRSIKSDANTGVCSIPDLPLYNPEIMQFYEKVDKLDCGNPDDDWVTCKVSQWGSQWDSF